MQTQSSCYKGTSKMTIKGILWHSTGANNPNLKRYVQPSDAEVKADTYTKEKWLSILGKNVYGNDWNHISIQAGLNCWIGKLADGSVTTIQTMPWDYKPWGCGKGAKGSCNNGWIQFEICEDNLSDKDYFNKIYQEACEITAYLCKLYSIDPNGTVAVNGVEIPTILCHADSHKLGFGSNHGDIDHWFPKYGKSMITARQDVAKLLKEAGTPVSSVKSYKVITAINRYTNAADAAAQKNAKADMLTPGTYYIYNKYPDGVNGMYNISIDSTGNSAGSWINPKENVLQESTPTPEPSKLYRVRKDKDDIKSQIGAYTELQNAINACQDAGDGYHVFDWNYTLVYSYKSLEQEEKPEPVTAVYDLEYPEKTKIIDSTIKRTDKDCVKVIKKILTNNSSFDIDIAKVFFEVATKYKIDPMMAIAQSILETGWFKYANSSVTAEQHNYCGLGVTSNGVKGGSFEAIKDGVTAQLQHLYAYGCKENLPTGESIIDPRFSLVTRGIAPTWQQLAGRWACPGYDSKTYSTPKKAMEADNTYGQKILTICKSLEAVIVTDEDIKKYFFTEQEDLNTPIEPEITPDIPDVVEPPVPDPVQPDIEDDQVVPDNSKIVEVLLILAKKLVQLLIKLFKKETT